MHVSYYDTQDGMSSREFKASVDLSFSHPTTGTDTESLYTRTIYMQDLSWLIR